MPIDDYKLIYLIKDNIRYNIDIMTILGFSDTILNLSVFKINIEDGECVNDRFNLFDIDPKRGAETIILEITDYIYNVVI